MSNCINSCKTNNKKCCECIKYKEEAEKLLQEAKAFRFQASEYTKSAKDLFNTEQIYAQRINELKEEARIEEEKSREFEAKYNQCIMMIKCMSNYNKGRCTSSTLSICEECKYYEKQYKDLRNSAIEKDKYTEVLNEERELLYQIAAGHISDATLLSEGAQQKEFEAREKIIEYEQCIK